MTGQVVYDPRPPVTSGDTHGRAPRVRTLDGAVVAIVDNGKTHAGVLLRLVVEELCRHWSIEGVVEVGPPSPGRGGPLEDAVLAAQWATVAIAGVGDCGSCSSATMTDALFFERLGIPAVPVVTTPFVPTAQAIAALQGFGDHVVVAVDHPLATLDDAALVERALVSARAVAAALIGRDDELSAR